MNALWAPAARQDRASIFEYIHARNPDAAVRLDGKFDDAVNRLADFPMLGHVGDVAGTREYSAHRKYRLVYQVIEDTIWIVAVIHTSRQWPPELD